MGIFNVKEIIPFNITFTFIENIHQISSLNSVYVEAIFISEIPKNIVYHIFK